ncbi:MAG TPA: GNAT family N-acetyltransferase [Bryobacteraceae bacterium]|nr:GNAT family N-acetyltransferase [Bryobacteraceae bacterium]
MRDKQAGPDVFHKPPARYDECMAALSDRYDGPVVELRRVAADDLSSILEEETGEWRTSLDWDFRPSADLVRRFVHMQALGGFAFMANAGRAPMLAGYSYFVCEEGKGLIGDLYVMREHRSLETETALLNAVLAAMWHTPGVRRIESQIMLLSSPMERTVPYPKWFRAYPRQFLEIPRESILSLRPRNLAPFRIVLWTEPWQEATARLIARSYLGHIDSQINDQYRTISGARRFLTNIVQYPGCGSFFAPASYAATDVTGRELHGISLSSLVASDIGHITQVCVDPSDRGTGLGYELVRQSLAALAAHGCRIVSLTVTTANESALRLYQRMGFMRRRDFAAYIWERR